MSKLDEVYNSLLQLENKGRKGISAIELSNFMDLDRANISRYLNTLYKEGKLEKTEGRPVLYSVIKKRIAFIKVKVQL